MKERIYPYNLGRWLITSQIGTRRTNCNIISKSLVNHVQPLKTVPSATQNFNIPEHGVHVEKGLLHHVIWLKAPNQ